MNLGITSAIVSASNDDASDPTKEGALLTALESFRNSPNIKNLTVTTMTYDPMRGVTNLIPPSGIKQVYIYDTANRLKEIRESNPAGNILKENKYNYKN